MKLLIIAPEQNPVPPPVGGSVENCIFQISKQISNRHQVTIVSLQRKGLPKKTKMGHVTILRVRGGSKKTYLSHVMKKVKGGHFDLIQIDNRPSFVRVVRRAFPTTPISVFLHSVTFVTSPMTTRRQAAIDLREADLIIGNSGSLKRTLQHMFPQHKKKIKYVHLGVDLTQFHPGKQISQGRFRVLFAGRLIPRKGIPVLMKAIHIARKTAPAVHLTVAGGTHHAAYKKHLKKLASSLRLPVTFIGNVSRSRMPAFYRSGNCFVCPSQKLEAFGLVNVEAMASGLPVIASHNGGIPEIVKHESNGLLVKSYRHPEAFAKHIVYLAKHPEVVRRLGKQARKDVETHFSWKKTAKNLMQIYQSAI
ncbi:hypothetical protein BVG16_01600 [Paenibacillus selenitireducens]|uniref:Spore coat protein n=1 Tax=Paenibacillus selenitireducens TaxID=1324314 RepID=A0A1T2XNT1_9BACL|nr:glycosyltransferase family 4 protein [Paenibacillus selenitireducens]OPA81511.1 hypothetical protein BVG16_01600 [Paenibacillus selenitireducens]